MRDPVGLIMDLPVNFDRQPRLGAVEVENIGTDRMLTSEFQPAKLPSPQADP